MQESQKQSGRQDMASRPGHRPLAMTPLAATTGLSGRQAKMVHGTVYKHIFWRILILFSRKVNSEF
jgi:hypothetical protein